MLSTGHGAGHFQLTSHVAPEQAASDLEAAIASMRLLASAASLCPSGVQKATDWSIIDVGAGTGLVLSSHALSLSLYLSLARSPCLCMCVCLCLSRSLVRAVSLSLYFSRMRPSSRPLSAPQRGTPAACPDPDGSTRRWGRSLQRGASPTSTRSTPPRRCWRRCFGALMLWCVGVLVFWCFGA